MLNKIKDIKEEKKEKFKSNIKYLEELSNSLHDSIDNLKIMYEKIIENKEELKLNIYFLKFIFLQKISNLFSED